MQEGTFNIYHISLFFRDRGGFSCGCCHVVTGTNMCQIEKGTAIFYRNDIFCAYIVAVICEIYGIAFDDCFNGLSVIFFSE